MIELFLFVIGLVALSGFMSLFEVSVFSCTPLQMSMLIKKNPHLKLFETKSKEITSAIIVSNIVVDIGGSTIGGTMAYKLFGGDIEYTLYTVFITLALLIFSTLIPKLNASSHAPSILRVFGKVILLIYYIMKPVVNILYVIVNLFVRGKAEESITQSEISSMIALAETSNVLSGKQSRLINNVVNISSKTVKDVFEENTSIDTVEVDKKVSDYEHDIIKVGLHKRYVVISKTDGKAVPVGIVLYRDMVRAYVNDKAESTSIADIMHEVSITYDDDNALTLMDKLDRNGDHITVVVSRENETMTNIIQSDDIVKNLIK